MYSSGTTGLPKCMVHGAGGTLLQHLKELVLHTDLTPRRPDLLLHHLRLDDVELAGLQPRRRRHGGAVRRRAARAAPRSCGTWRPQERVTVFGTSAKYLALAEKEGLRAGARRHDLSALRAILSTGSPLAPGGLRLRLPRHQDGRPPRQHQRRHRHHLLLRARQSDRAGLARRAADPGAGHGGRGVRRPRAPGARRATASWSARGRSPACRSPSGTIPTAPSTGRPTSTTTPASGAMATGRELTEHDGLVITGRSDATLNPGGVRIGTAEIYRQVEQLPEVVESLVVGQEWEGDVRIVLFVRLRRGRRARRGAARTGSGAGSGSTRARTTCRGASSRCADIPRTISGKITELAVREVIHGRPGEQYRRAGESRRPRPLPGPAATATIGTIWGPPQPSSKCHPRFGVLPGDRNREM